MEKHNFVKKKINISSLLIISLIVAIAFGVIADLVLVYKPDQNALGALGTVCLDIICLVVLLILIVSLTFEKDDISHTTKLFLTLMVGTMVAIFFDFLTWSSDGALVYGGWTYFFTMASLTMGSVLAGVFIIYLSAYLIDMYELTAVKKFSKVLIICNLFSFCLTFVLGITNKAFDFVDGHYVPGAMYDLVTVIPVLSLILMTGFSIRYIKIIGIHDVLAVGGFIFTMVCGAMIETAFGIGATYVSVAIADIFIFIMLQNKLIDRVKKQGQILSEKITSQYEILESMAGIYSHVNYVDLEHMTEKRLSLADEVDSQIDLIRDPHTSLNKSLSEDVDDEQKEAFLAFTNLSTLPDRLAGEKMITAEFYHKKDGWFRAQYIRIGDSVDLPLKKVIYAIHNIDKEKKNVEKWIRKSNTDELTGFFNRHAYEDAIALVEKEIEEKTIKKDFVYVSIDINSLKSVNDTLGHSAGDELIIGACECMKTCFGPFGELYRTGGDEFVALIYADEKQLDSIKADVEKVTGSWSGKFVEKLAISCGYVTLEEAEDRTLHQIAVLADKRMYEAKSKFYRRKGVDRRGQRDAHVALCNLYTKILKINITEDTYQIINMDASEQTQEKGFATTISQWLSDFGTTGQVHPDDLDEYNSKTKLDYMKNYFRNGNSSLTVFYRRKYNDHYKKVMMEIIPANDYTDEVQTLFLYVKNIE